MQEQKLLSERCRLLVWLPKSSSWCWWRVCPPQNDSRSCIWGCETYLHSLGRQGFVAALLTWRNPESKRVLQWDRLEHVPQGAILWPRSGGNCSCTSCSALQQWRDFIAEGAAWDGVPPRHSYRAAFVRGRWEASREEHCEGITGWEEKEAKKEDEERLGRESPGCWGGDLCSWNILRHICRAVWAVSNLPQPAHGFSGNWLPFFSEILLTWVLSVHFFLTLHAWQTP